MAKKRKTPQKRLKEAIDLARGPHLRDLLPKPDYSDAWDRRIMADRVLTLSDRPIDASLRIAFEAFGLDPKDPYDWLILVRIMSEILFGQPAANSSDKPITNSSGRPLKWDERRRRQFDYDVAWARERVTKILREQGEPEPITHNDIALYLKLALPQLYTDIAQETLRKYVASGPPKGGAVKIVQTL
jgi:hypothetical protein